MSNIINHYNYNRNTPKVKQFCVIKRKIDIIIKPAYAYCVLIDKTPNPSNFGLSVYC